MICPIIQCAHSNIMYTAWFWFTLNHWHKKMMSVDCTEAKVSKEIVIVGM